nr:hypothetical protein [uncultured Kingella sp.]
MRDFSIKGSLKRRRRNQETLLGKMGAMGFQAALGDAVCGYG